MKVLVIIPARGNSKGVPGKNIMKFNDIPLINYTVRCALNSKLVHKIVVSSDDSEILEIANISERIILHKRNKELAKDKSLVVDTLFSVVDFIKEKFDVIMLLQPTSPIRDRM